MRKFIIVTNILLCFFLVACDKVSMTTETTPIIFSTSETTSFISTLTETTIPIIDVQRYHTKKRETQSLQTEIPELQAKIDRYQDHGYGVPSKIVIEVGEQRDIPYLELICGEFIDNGGIVRPERLFALSNEDIIKNVQYYPIYTVTGSECINIYSNDECVESFALAVIDLNRENSKLSIFNTLEELVSTMPTGKYFVKVDVVCYGDYIMDEHGDHLYHNKGSSRESIATEYMQYEAYFILELVDLAD